MKELRNSNVDHTSTHLDMMKQEEESSRSAM